MAASLNPYISNFDTDFDVEKSAQYRLTIQLALGGLSFALFDTIDNRIIGLECYQSDLLTDNNDLSHAMEKALDAKGLNNKKLHSVFCIIDERTNVLVPDALYSPVNNDQLLGFSFNTTKDIVTQTDPLKKHKAVNVFAFSRTLQLKINEKWPKATVIHSSSVFLESLPENAKAMVHVNVRNRDFDMAVMKDKLLFFNNFRFNTKDDFAYFLLFAMEQYGLSGQDTTVCISGLILPSSEIIDLCGHYVKDIQFIEKPDELMVGEALAEVPYQYYHIHYQTLRHETRVP